MLICYLIAKLCIIRAFGLIFIILFYSLKSLSVTYHFRSYWRCRVTTQACGFTGLVPDQCQVILQTHTTIIRGKISNRLVLGKANSHHKTMAMWDTQISIIPKPVSPWINNKTLEMDQWEGLKANLSNPNSSYGKTATNLHLTLSFLQGLVMSAKVASLSSRGWII